jgi:hypothetical protein
MAYNDFMNKIRQWDNHMAKWMMQHFYFLFFQILLVLVFFIWFTNLIGVINATLFTPLANPAEKLLATQSINTTIIVFLMLLNSFWILYIFNSLMRMHGTLKDLSFHMSRMRRTR